MAVLALGCSGRESESLPPPPPAAPVLSALPGNVVDAASAAAVPRFKPVTQFKLVEPRDGKSQRSAFVAETKKRLRAVAVCVEQGLRNGAGREAIAGQLVLVRAGSTVSVANQQELDARIERCVQEWAARLNITGAAENAHEPQRIVYQIAIEQRVIDVGNGVVLE